MTVPHSMLDQSVLRSPICLGVIAKIRALFAYFGGTGGGISLLLRLAGGEAGIRTLGTGVSPYNGLANRRIRPLCHLSGVRSYSLARLNRVLSVVFLLARIFNELFRIRWIIAKVKPEVDGLFRS